MTPIHFVVYGKPQQRGSKTPWLPRHKDGSLVMKNGRPVIATMDSNKNSKAWMQSVREAAIIALPSGFELIHMPVRLAVEFHFARPQSHFGSGKNAGTLKATAPRLHAQSPDLDKLCRCLADALIGIVIADDKLIYSWNAQREWTTGSEYAHVRIDAGENNFERLGREVAERQNEVALEALRKSE